MNRNFYAISLAVLCPLAALRSTRALKSGLSRFTRPQVTVKAATQWAEDSPDSLLLIWSENRAHYTSQDVLEATLNTQSSVHYNWARSAQQVQWATTIEGDMDDKSLDG